MTLTKKGESRPAPASWGLASRPGAPWEYAPAPEATDHIQIRPEYGLFIDNEFTPRQAEEDVPGHQPGHRRAAGEGRPRLEGRRRPRRQSSPPRLRQRLVATSRQRARQVPLSASPESSRSEAREFAVVETHERRQADQGVARRRRPARRRALLLLRRLGGQARIRVPGPQRRARSAWPAQVIPWNFPLLMLAWKIAPGAGRRQHGGPQARLDDAAHRATCFAESSSQAELPPGVVNIITGPARSGMALVSPSRTSTRSPSPAPPPSAS